MRAQRNKYSLIAVIVCIFLGGVSVRADDSAASTAAGGIQLRKEVRISMQKERLLISPDKVAVDFWFLNETDKSITTEVAFPVPPYTFYWDDPAGIRGFADFKLWVEGAPLSYKTEVHAILHGYDYYGLLHKMGIDAATFGMYDWKKDPPDGSPQISKLSPEERGRLIKLGLLDNSDDAFPEWTVKKLYYWQQMFPAQKTIHIRHEYKPVIGYEYIHLQDFPTELPHACVDSNLQKALSADADAYLNKTPRGEARNFFNVSWVDYVLTTANTWKTPIGDFQVVIEKPEARNGEHVYTSLCWDGPIRRLDERHILLQKKNFVPKQEITVYFIWKMTD